MDSPKEVTIYDIAKKLDVSPSTVSRALKDDPTVSKNTKKKVFETAARMGYRSNQFARNLRQQQSLTIGVIVSELNNPFITSVLSGIEKIAGEAGYGIIITDSSQSAKKEAANAQNLFQRRVDGIIASLAPDTKDLAHFKPFVTKGIPVIFLDRVEHMAESTSVVINNVMCGYVATKHLIEQGCRRIAHVTSALQHNIYAQRYKGYRDALEENKIPFDESLLVIMEEAEEAGEAAAKKIMRLQPMPDGVFVTGDFAAAVCIRTFQDNGVRVPEDMAVVGFNNEVIGRLIKPTLTTINYPGKEMGEAAARNLVNHLKGLGNIGSISTLTIRADLIVRQSSLKTG
ncbi:LacI family DNA-binding transcriptional regulator [Flavitalea sp. BT771]|uniref:LacI family DNA-binding transcriptional regulator n=1 Tax=Flavitalea sp. BT771 TaxID=3063329 RepID=UPI0026E1D42B|nr:LacI family DNA-binding transcriptional regulator [Flavitalea sp. BT771]MDO6430333.1 LacI family DNA-binding transcriptional regulator [Flavitalea sp. BT771]MDV6219527.1 LacI family DNA-binding transcriptional regulator [Flavitalea sp. BT771]